MAETALLVAAVGSTVLQAAGSIQQGQAARSAANYNAQVAENNAAAARAQAAENARRQRVMNKKALGSIRAGYGASGVTLEGSPLDVLEESAMNAELDALSIEHAGLVRALGFQNDAALERFGGRNASRAGYMGAAAALLGGGARIASMSIASDPAPKPKRYGDAAVWNGEP
jgi:hypothetical protein